MGAEAPVMAPAVMPAAAVPAKTPEQAVADQIVPEDKGPKEAPPAEKKEDVMKTASINVDLLKGLLDLARAGKI
jgi:hypothetical protein